MQPQSDEQAEKRTVYAPHQDSSISPSAIISVELAADEEVEWIWTHLLDGKSVVTGYEIKKATPQPKALVTKE